MSRLVGTLAVVLALVPSACGGATETSAPVEDSSTDSTNDVADAPVDTGVAYGSCGKTIYTCLCGCEGGVACENTCYDAACLKCIDDGTTGCCPTEYPAWKACLIEATTAPDGGAAPCAKTDTKCVDDHCKTQAAALQTCLGTSGCKSARAVCTGTYPASCGK
jgi:hypothetical protein